MKITREHVTEARSDVSRTIPDITGVAAAPAAWLALALAGVALAVAADDPALTAIGVVVAAVGAYGVGIRDGRRDRSPDPRVSALTAANERLARERDAAFYELLDRDDPARGAGVGQPGPAGREPRPSAGLRGGGRPGAVAPLAAVPDTDAPLPGESAGALA